ncbi:MAG: hypothetical protein V3S69_00540, partial [Dehalococcoidales bacterium]
MTSNVLDMDKLLNLIAAVAIIVSVFMLINEASAYDSTPDQVITLPVIENPTVYTECVQHNTRTTIIERCRFSNDGDWFLVSSRGGLERLGKHEPSMEDYCNTV